MTARHLSDRWTAQSLAALLEHSMVLRDHEVAIPAQVFRCFKSGPIEVVFRKLPAVVTNPLISWAGVELVLSAPWATKAEPPNLAPASA